MSGASSGLGMSRLTTIRLLAAADDYCFYRLVFAGVLFLMRDVGRDVDESLPAGRFFLLHHVHHVKGGSTITDENKRYHSLRTGLAGVSECNRDITTVIMTRYNRAHKRCGAVREWTFDRACCPL